MSWEVVAEQTMPTITCRWGRKSLTKTLLFASLRREYGWILGIGRCIDHFLRALLGYHPIIFSQFQKNCSAFTEEHIEGDGQEENNHEVLLKCHGFQRNMVGKVGTCMTLRWFS